MPDELRAFWIEHTHDFLVESREKFKSCLEFPWQSTDMQLVFKNVKQRCVEASCGRFSLIIQNKESAWIRVRKKEGVYRLRFFWKKVLTIQTQTLFYTYDSKEKFNFWLGPLVLSSSADESDKVIWCRRCHLKKCQSYITFLSQVIFFVTFWQKKLNSIILLPKIQILTCSTLYVFIWSNVCLKRWLFQGRIDFFQ